nr:MAG TPA: hypothetical protein [Caudoviricetes sp.]
MSKENAVKDSFKKCQENFTTGLTCSRICDILSLITPLWGPREIVTLSLPHHHLLHRP